MIVLVHMLVFAFKDISSSVGLDNAIIAVQAAEAILDAIDASVCLSPPNSSELSLVCTPTGPG